MEGRRREGSQGGGGEKSEASISTIEPNSMYMVTRKHLNTIDLSRPFLYHFRGGKCASTLSKYIFGGNLHRSEWLGMVSMCHLLDASQEN